MAERPPCSTPRHGACIVLECLRRACIRLASCLRRACVVPASCLRRVFVVSSSCLRRACVVPDSCVPACAAQANRATAVLRSMAADPALKSKLDSGMPLPQPEWPPRPPKGEKPPNLKCAVQPHRLILIVSFSHSVSHS